MDIRNRLDNLSEAVITAFSDNFIFLISSDKVQHYPARDWTKEEVQASLTERLGTDYTLAQWQERVIAINQTRDLVAVIPKYQRIEQVK